MTQPEEKPIRDARAKVAELEAVVAKAFAETKAREAEARVAREGARLARDDETRRRVALRDARLDLEEVLREARVAKRMAARRKHSKLLLPAKIRHRGVGLSCVLCPPTRTARKGVIAHPTRPDERLCAECAAGLEAKMKTEGGQAT